MVARGAADAQRRTQGVGLVVVVTLAYNLIVAVAAALGLDATLNGFAFCTL